MPSTPTAAKNCPPIKNAGKGANHQAVKGPSTISHAPSFFIVTPVAAELKGGTVGSAYSETISAAGGTAPYTFAVTSGTLPTGTSLAPSTGIISGTVTTAGSYSFTITATDANAIAGSRVFQIAVLAPAVSNYGFVA